MDVIEIIVGKQLSDQNFRDALKDILEFAEKMHIENEDLKKRLIDRIRGLQEESISRACKDSIKHHLGEDRAKEFSKLYAVRSAIAHGSFFENEKASIPDHHRAYEMAYDFLLAKIG